MSHTAAKTIGQYRVLHPLASGGMGEVVLARHQGPAGFEKLVVIKKMLPHLEQDPQVVKQFQREARAAALLQHPNVVQVFELGEEAGSFYIVMEPVLGHSLREIADALKAQNRPFPPEELARILAQALNGLHYAHTLKDETGRSLGIVHRDISPENVMVTFHGAVKVVDFGLAKSLELSAKRTSGGLKGKFGYMAPEQLLARPIDARADVWGVGVVLYELLAGRRPYPAITPDELLAQMRAGPPSRLPATAPPELEQLCRRALTPDLRQRFPSAQAFATALDRFAVSRGATLTDAQTARFMRELYGDKADSALSTGALPPPSEEDGGEMYLSVMKKNEESVIEPPKGPARALIFGGVAVTVLLVAITAVLLLTPKRGVAPPTPVAPDDAAGGAAAVDPTQADAAAGGGAAVVEVATADVPSLPARPAAPKKKGYGQLQLNVTPWADVYEGGKLLGRTGGEAFELPIGRHLLMLRNSELGAMRRVKVAVPKRGVATVTVDLTK